MDEGDFGVRSGSKDYEDEENYEVSYLSDLESGDVLEGEIYMSKIQDSEKTGDPFFNIIITNHDLEEKWVITFWKPKMVEDGTVMYAKKPYRNYQLIDSMLCAMFGKEREAAPYQSVVFDKFRDAINNMVLNVKAEIVDSQHALSKKGDLVFTSVEKAEQKG